MGTGSCCCGEEVPTCPDQLMPTLPGTDVLATAVVLLETLGSCDADFEFGSANSEWAFFNVGGGSFDRPSSGGRSGTMEFDLGTLKCTRLELIVPAGNIVYLPNAGNTGLVKRDSQSSCPDCSTLVTCNVVYCTRVWLLSGAAPTATVTAAGWGNCNGISPGCAGYNTTESGAVTSTSDWDGWSLASRYIGSLFTITHGQVNYSQRNTNGGSVDTGTFCSHTMTASTARIQGIATPANTNRDPRGSPLALSDFTSTISRIGGCSSLGSFGTASL